jgi:hypothetical protein
VADRGAGAVAGIVLDALVDDAFAQFGGLGAIVTPPDDVEQLLGYGDQGTQRASASIPT